jgi:hypothetical protein
MQRKTILNRVEKQKGFGPAATISKRSRIDSFWPRAKRLSWKKTASIFGTSWDSVFRAIQWVVHWGIVHRDLTGIESIGIDEIQYRRGHNYLTLVYQLDQGFKRLLYVRKDRTEESLNGFFNLLDSKTIAGIKYACTDRWPAYLKVLKERASATLNILDRFHIAKKFGEALDKGLPDAGRLPSVLGLHVTGVGIEIPSRVLYSSKSLADRADAKGRQDASQARAVATQLVRIPGPLLGYC